jgi:peptidoglycan glycosyltransferase
MVLMGLALAALLGALALRQVISRPTYLAWRYTDPTTLELWNGLVEQGLFGTWKGRVILNPAAFARFSSACQGAWTVEETDGHRRVVAAGKSGIPEALATLLAVKGFVQANDGGATLDSERLKVVIMSNLDNLASEEGKVVVVDRRFSRGRASSPFIPKGAILDRHGERLAYTPAASATGRLLQKRVYSLGAAGFPVLGTSRLGSDAMGLEKLARTALSGLSAKPSETHLIPARYGMTQGADLVTTLDFGLQRRAYDLLGRKGAAIVMAAPTGEILAMASYPSPDPSDLIFAGYQQLERDPDQPLINRCTDRTYPPGSVFKLVDLAAALEDPDPSARHLAVECKGANTHGIRCVEDHGHVTLDNALEVSCNYFYSEAAVRMGPYLRDTASRLGFNQLPPSLLPRDWDGPAWTPAPSLALAQFDEATGSFFSPVKFGKGEARLVAMCGIGQNMVAATPLQVASLTQTIAGGGIWRAPKLLADAGRYPDPERRMSKVVADDITYQMQKVYTQGTASKLPRLTFNGARYELGGEGEPVKVACKTGTAQVIWEEPGTRRLLQKPPHSWFTAFAPADDPKVVVTVLIENGGWGAVEAGQRALTLLAEALNAVSPAPKEAFKAAPRAGDAKPSPARDTVSAAATLKAAVPKDAPEPKAPRKNTRRHTHPGRQQ